MWAQILAMNTTTVETQSETGCDVVSGRMNGFAYILGRIMSFHENQKRGTKISTMSD